MRKKRVTAAEADLVADQGITRSGTVVAGRYRLQSLLGSGGMGRVWQAEDEVLTRSVAVKQVVPAQATSAHARAARMLALWEARAAARVHHVGAVQIHDVVREKENLWIIMELLSGRTLAAVLRAEGPLPLDRVARVGLCLLDVLQAAHRAGIVHCDVKPANVHLCHDGRVVLADFGVARTAGGSNMSTGELAGSPPYIAPERIHGHRVQPASDMFSLGATLFTAVEGRLPFDEGSPSATLTAVIEGEVAPFVRAGPLQPVIEGLLANKPGQRLDADQARAALQGIRATTSRSPRHSGSRVLKPSDLASPSPQVGEVRGRASWLVSSGLG
jgi:eukaryotic-like serine/threonine-protein kinase